MHVDDEPLKSHVAVLPVAPWALSHAPRAHERFRELHEVDVHVLASLVRARLHLERGRGWFLLLGLATTVTAVVLMGVLVHSKMALGILAPLVASLPFTAGLFADRASRAAFESIARAHGLSPRASERIFENALGADHWIAVLTECGRAPTDGEIARFVMQH